ncbi:nuclease-related domain-containing protein [Virgibacillus tibetensis]
MILKQHDKLLEVLQLEALDNRLEIFHPKKELVQHAFKIKKTEVRGEKEVDYPLHFLDDQHYIILHNLRLTDESGYFQIDTLILTKNFILILEVKNWYGTLLFSEDGQVIRIGDDQKEEGFPDPVVQARIQQYRLQKWLRKCDIPIVPIDFFVVISFPSTIIKPLNPNNKIPKEVIHNNHLFFRIQDLDQIYTQSILKKTVLMNLAKNLIDSHTPPKADILKKYSISKSDLIKGVICPKCSSTRMVREKRKWLCKTCNYTSVTAHAGALNEYKLLVGDMISNRETREFLQVNSPDVARRLLKMEKFQSVGNTKGKLYKLHFSNYQVNAE